MNALFVTTIPEERKTLFTNENISVTFKNKNEVTQEDLQDVEIVFGNLPLTLLNNAPKLKLVQLDSAGANQYADLRQDIILCNASGAYDTAISEHMLAYTLAIMKNVFPYYHQQKDHNWHNLGSVPTVQNMNVLSVGMGNIGSAYVQKMKLLGAHVSGVRRTIHEKPENLDHLYTFQQLKEILPQFDIVALSLPETFETIGLFDYDMLTTMKQNAILLNVGRGSAIIEKDLIRAIKEEHLKAACLDVTQIEPLPEDSPLWSTENIYVTPHISGRFNAEVTYDKVLQIFHTNLLHYLNNEPLEHIVDRKRGY